MGNKLSAIRKALDLAILGAQMRFDAPYDSRSIQGRMLNAAAENALYTLKELREKAT